MYHTWKNIKTSYKKFQVLAPTRNEKFELPDDSYSISDVQGYFKNSIKDMKQKMENY